MYMILNAIGPKYILSMNWISRRESLYKVWTSKHPHSKFIVVQHGAYVGGYVTDISHRYTKCDIFLTWGPYFSEMFAKYNQGKSVRIVSFGNPVYNDLNRDFFSYRECGTFRILLIPTALDWEALPPFAALIKKLQQIGFEVLVKEHAFQGVIKDESGKLKYPLLEDVNKLTGQLYSILQNNNFDFVISDHSSALLDAIFFKNKVIYFDPNSNKTGYTTNYANYLPNLYLQTIDQLNSDLLYGLINIQNQENLLLNMISFSENILEKL